MTVARACALSFLAAMAVYWGTLDNGFAWDDHLHVVGDPFVSDPTNIAHLLTADFWRGKLAIEGSGRPVLLASFLVDRAYWSDLAAGYHLTNILLHASVAAALAALAAGLLASPVAGAVAGLLFALHPAQSEAVCSIAFRGELLAALFGLLALLARRRAAAEGGLAWLAASAAGFGLALLSKENAVAWPALAVLDEAFAPAAARMKPRRAVVHAIVFASVLGGYAAFRLPRGDYAALRPAVAMRLEPAAKPRAEKAGASAQPQAAKARPAVNPEGPRTPAFFDPSAPAWASRLKDRGTRLRTMSGVFLDYARLTVWPSGLQADRAAPVVERWASPRFWGGIGLIAGLLAAAWAMRRARPVASLGLLWFLVTLAPVSGILPLYNLIAERYLYMPLAGAALLAAALFDAARRTRRPALAPAIVVAALASASMATARRVPAWRDDAALFGSEPVTENSRLRYNRGRLAREAGRFDDAASEYRRAIELNPRSVEALVNLAEVEASVGRFDEQFALLRRAVDVAPQNGIALTALGAAHERRGHPTEALAHYERAVLFDPTLGIARRRYATILLQAGRHEDALAQARIGTELEPSSVEAALLLGRIAQDAQAWPRCARALQAAKRLDSRNAFILANLGICTHQWGRQKNDRGLLRAAIAPLRQAAALLPGSADVRGALASVYMDLSMFPQARASYADALKIQPSSPQLWHDYAVSLHRDGRFDAAIDAYERALLLNPGKVESLVNLASFRAAANRFDEARALIDRAEQVRPLDPVVRAAAEAIELARTRAETN